jgi:hypothetical protein
MRRSEGRTGMKTSPLLIPVLLVMATPRAAEASGTEVIGFKDTSGGVSVSAPVLPEYKPAKSHGTAYAWALGGSLGPGLVGLGLMATEDSEWEVIGAGLLLYGLFIGPSTGQFHADAPGRAWFGIGLRAVGAIAGVYYALVIDGPCMSDNCDAYSGAAPLVVLWGIGTAYSLVDTYFAVNRANERARKAAPVRTSISPALFPTRDGRLAPGLALNARW